jgi:hypothetical protein
VCVCLRSRNLSSEASDALLWAIASQKLKENEYLQSLWQVTKMQSAGMNVWRCQACFHRETDRTSAGCRIVEESEKQGSSDRPFAWRKKSMIFLERFQFSPALPSGRNNMQWQWTWRYGAFGKSLCTYKKTFPQLKETHWVKTELNSYTFTGIAASSIPNAPSTWLIFLCPRTHASSQNLPPFCF